MIAERRVNPEVRSERTEILERLKQDLVESLGVRHPVRATGWSIRIDIVPEHDARIAALDSAMLGDRMNHGHQAAGGHVAARFRQPHHRRSFELVGRPLVFHPFLALGSDCLFESERRAFVVGFQIIEIVAVIAEQDQIRRRGRGSGRRRFRSCKRLACATREQ